MNPPSTPMDIRCFRPEEFFRPLDYSVDDVDSLGTRLEHDESFAAWKHPLKEIGWSLPIIVNRGSRCRTRPSSYACARRKGCPMRRGDRLMHEAATSPAAVTTLGPKIARHYPRSSFWTVRLSRDQSAPFQECDQIGQFLSRHCLFQFVWHQREPGGGYFVDVATKYRIGSAQRSL